MSDNSLRRFGIAVFLLLAILGAIGMIFGIPERTEDPFEIPVETRRRILEIR